MLKTCFSFAEAHSLIFNASKTQLICFSKTCLHRSLSITFLGHELQLCNSVTHLGQILAYNLSDDLDINRVTSDVCRQANYLLATFSACDILTKTELFRSYCMSLYGSVLWNFGQSIGSATICWHCFEHNRYSLAQGNYASIIGKLIYLRSREMGPLNPVNHKGQGSRPCMWQGCQGFFLS